ncbi:alpha-2-macroglobulin family protein [Marinilabiliaceae bacterium ANBcel2]|nr:alpha-2-macroglobulin family protein [Marinilabiliaceae bacterium ANBcel2]
MKYICFLSVLLLVLGFKCQEVGENKWSYQDRWHKADSLIARDLPESALKVLKEISEESIKEKQSVDFIKAEVKIVELRNRFSPSAVEEAVDRLEELSDQLWSPAKEIVHSFIADLYIKHYHEHSSSRFDKSQFKADALKHYKKSLNNPELLLSEKSAEYVDILSNSDEGLYLRPTLYDLLAIRSSQSLLSNDIFDNSRFFIKSFYHPQLLGDVNTFISINIDEVEDDYQRAGVAILQDYLKQRQSYEDTTLNSSFIDADLFRLQLIYNNIRGSYGVLRLYEDALKSLLSDAEQEGSRYPAILYHYAKFLYDHGKTAICDDRNYLVEALSFARKAVDEAKKNGADSEIVNVAGNLAKRILNPSVNIQGEKVVALQPRYIFLVESKNIDTLYSTLFELDYPDFTTREIYNENRFLEVVKNQDYINQKETVIPHNKDHRSYSAELSVPLPKTAGYYLLLTSTEPFTGEVGNDQLFNFIDFQVTDLSFISRDKTNETEFFIADRNSGEPKEGVEATSYIYGRNGSLLNSIHSSSDRYGRALLPRDSQQSGNRLIVVEKEGDRYFTSQSQRRLMGDNKQRGREELFLFTDRKVYRQGQTLFFKGVKTYSDGEEIKVMDNEKVEVVLRDVNNREIAKREFVTNEYGSFSGEFQLPQTALTGTYLLSGNNRRVALEVEKYRRPRFEVMFEPYRDVDLPGDSIQLRGSAVTLTGVPLQDAKVIWRVKKRESLFPRINSSTDEIASGTTFTNSKGEFYVDFKSDPHYNNHNYFSYDYMVTATVTDKNGETRTGEIRFVLGSEPLKCNISVENIFVFDNREQGNNKEVSFKVNLKNLVNEKVDGVIDYSISRLKIPDKIAPRRYWSRADTILCEHSSNSFFDKDGYPWQHYSVEEVVSQKKGVKVNREKEFNLDLNRGGYYRIDIEATSINNKEVSVNSSIPFAVIESESSEYMSGEPLSLFIYNDNYAPGDTIKFKTATPFVNGTVFITATRGSDILYSNVVEASKRWYSDDIVIPDNYRGTIFIQSVAIDNNRIYQNRKEVNVVEAAEVMNLELIRFSKDVKPGGKEEWGLQLKDGAGNIRGGEVLALMYDSSLDAYSEHSLQMNPFTRFWGSTPWQWNNFNSVYGSGRGGIYLRALYPKEGPTFFWSDKLLFSSQVMRLAAVADGSESPVSHQSKAVEESTLADNTIEHGAIESRGAPVREQLNETAFFLPHLRADDKGRMQIDFEMPEALTRWKFITLAHDKNGASGVLQEYITTSLPLMVVLEIPRVVREGDKVEIAVNIINNSDIKMSGEASLIVRDAVTGEELDILSLKSESNLWQSDILETSVVKWGLKVPTKGIKGLELVASAHKTGRFDFDNSDESFFDGEKHFVPVLPSRIFITETRPYTLYGSGEHKFEFEPLLKRCSDDIESYRVSYTQNAAWETIGALPWLIEQPYESADQVFNRFLASSVSQLIIDNYPQIKRVIKMWANELPGDEDAFNSVLQRNPELKSLLLSSTPWLNEAAASNERRRKMVALINEERLQSYSLSALSLLNQMQLENGSWPWFKGMYPSNKITSDIVSGFGYLKNQGVIFDDETNKVIISATDYLRSVLKERYKELNKRKDSVRRVSPIEVNILYALSFFNESSSEAEKWWIKQLADTSIFNSVYLQSLSATILFRNGYYGESQKLIESVKEKFSIIGESGSFNVDYGPHWYHSSVETTAAAIEALRETSQSDKLLMRMEHRLIEKKRGMAWESSRATVMAIHALADSKRSYFSIRDDDVVEVADKELGKATRTTGSGYLNESWHGSSVTCDMSSITINKKEDHPSWFSAALTYYDEQKYVRSSGVIDVERNVYVRSGAGESDGYVNVDKNTIFKSGDKLFVEIVIDAPRDLDFVHVESPRPALTEPLIELSGYRWEKGLGYYLSVNDGGSDIFIDHLPQGRHKILREIIVTREGAAVWGPVKVQCYYAPEFSGNSSGGMIYAE